MPILTDRRETAHPFPPNAPARQRGVALAVKRLLDIMLAALLLLICSPLLVLVAALVRLTSPGPALYRGERLGRNQTRFAMLKFRTMRHNCSQEPHQALLESLLTDSPRDADGIYKLVGDERVTRFGSLLRRTSIDELPQLLNVLRGQMSLVGPRPEVPYVLSAYEPWELRRFDVLPGITGLWQVSGRATLPPKQMLRLDVEYADNWTLREDFAILWRTVPALLHRTGSV